MEKNFHPFYIGQKVVYITGVNMPKGSIHTVTNVRLNFCGNCYRIEINNIKCQPEHPDEINKATIIECGECGSCVHKETYLNSGYINDWRATSFRPLNEEFQSISYEKVLEEESLLISVN